MSAGSSGRG